ncbi:MAG: preprotein translocase subunit SecY [Clostridia bacterium]|nr:preprotein translocase subunit SecY [Clostridia bacterium]
MFKNLINAFKDSEIRKKLLITFALMFVFIIGTWIPTPGIDISVFKGDIESNTILGLLSSVSGGALSKGAILALGVSPYIFASIVVRTASAAFPSLRRLMQEGGEEGRKKINFYTRLVSLGFAIAYAIGIVLAFNTSIEPMLFNSTTLTSILVGLVLIAGAMFTVWIGEKITDLGIGNGLSLLVFIGILSSIATALVDTITNAFSSTANLDQLWNILILLVAVIIVFALIVFVDLARRKIPVNYAKQIKGRRMMGGASTDLDLKLNAGGVMPIIFATSILAFPQILLQTFWPNSEAYVWYNTYLGMDSWIFVVALAVLILLFSYFWSEIVFQPEEVARVIQERGGMVANFRPGRPTAEYLKRVNNRLVLFGAIYLTIVYLIPTILFKAIDSGSSLVTAFTGIGMLIIVSVALEFNKQLEEQMIVRNYKGFLK